MKTHIGLIGCDANSNPRRHLTLDELTINLSPSLLLLLILLLPIGSLPAADTNGAALAKTVLRKAGIHITLCELPRAGDGTLALALVQQGVTRVHALAPDSAAAELARKPALPGGLLGARVVIETGTPDQLPLGDWVADGLAVTDATDANLKALPAAEAARVLAPYRGVAVVGNPAGTKVGLSQEALAEWAKGTGGTAAISEDESGLWAVIRMPALAGADDWGHFQHRADGNLVSEDKALGLGPYELQWSNLPYLGAGDNHVISAGRMFTAQAVIGLNDVPRELVARNVYNGDILWRRPIISDDFQSFASLLIATPDKLFMAETNSVLILNPESGEDLRRVMLSNDPARSCLCLLESDGILLTVMGPAQTRWKGPLLPKNFIQLQEEFNAEYAGDELVAWDATNGKELWRFKESQIDPTKLVARNGRIYLYAKRQYAACMNLKTGAQIWKTDAPLQNDGKGPGLGTVGLRPDVAWSKDRANALVTSDVYLISCKHHQQCQAFSASDGHLLWSLLSGPKNTLTESPYDYIQSHMFMFPLVIGSNLIARNTFVSKKDASKASIFDALSGKTREVTEFAYGGCGRFTASSDGLLFGLCGEIYDINAHSYVAHYNAKSPCGTGQFVADGLLIKLATHCVSCGEWRGYYTSRAAPTQALRESVRLEKGSNVETIEAAAAAADWPTYRADVTRKASCAATVTAEGAIRWTYQPPAVSSTTAQKFDLSDLTSPVPTQPTPVISVGDLAWMGTAEGAVICLDQKTGMERWRYWTAGRIFSSPTWWQGRLYVGSADGWVYCLHAGKGTLQWRYRAAPEERRVIVWGHLSSAWPLMANVLVQDGVAYAACGLIGQIGGVSLCALDAKSGALRWEKRFPGGLTVPISTGPHPQVTREGQAPNSSTTAKINESAPKLESNGPKLQAQPVGSPSASGQLAWYQGQLWWHTGDSGVVAIEPMTGALKTIAFDGGHVRGQDIGVMPGGWLVVGGRQFNLPPDYNLEYDRYVCGFLKTSQLDVLRDAKGQPSLFQMTDLHFTDGIPTWDDTEVLFNGSTPWKGANPVLYRGLSDAQEGAMGFMKYGKGKVVCAGQQQLLPENMPAGIQKSFFYPILTRNAVVFFSRKKVQTDVAWSVVAADRTKQEILWHVDLPTVPVLGGLSVTRKGDVLVPLSDGQVLCVGAKNAGE